jgi:outer membrane protein OmpA-like peptidoglycan-associated protein
MSLSARIITFSTLLLLLPLLSTAQDDAIDSLRFYPMSEINTDELEYTQGLMGQEILLVRPAIEGARKDPATKGHFFNLNTFNSVDGSIKELPHPIKSPVHEGSACWSEATQELIFSRNLVSEPDAKGDRAGLYIWQNGYDTVSAFPYNNMGTIVCHPTISANGNLLVFAADFPDSYGGMDLYYSIRNEGVWEKPVNLGPAINTPGNDVFPFLHRSGTLFYSSTGFGGLGGLDLLYATPLSNVWQRPILLPPPFNSSGDDFAMWLNPLGTAGFMNTNREKQQKDDVYQFEANHPLFIEHSEYHDIELLDERTMAPIKNAIISLQFNQAWNPPFRKNKRAVPEAKKPWLCSELTTNQSGLTRIGLSEGLWLQVQIDHPDYQPWVSIERFDVENQWHQFLLTPKCSSLSGAVYTAKELAPVDGLTVSFFNPVKNASDTTYTSSDGKFEICLPLGEQIELTFSGKDWKTMTTPTIEFAENGQQKKWFIESGLTSSQEKGIPDGPIEKGSVFVFDRIYYDYNDSEIRKDATADLDALAAKMKEMPKMRIELIAHTDSRGASDYNLRLSVARAKAAKKYLVKKGVSPDRLYAVGHGENQLRNHCKDGVECSEEEHAFNRRTEVRVISVE